MCLVHRLVIQNRRLDCRFSIMTGIYLFYLVVALSLLTACSSLQKENNLQENHHDHVCVSVAEIIWLYYTAVDRGELKLFGSTVRRDRLEPSRIEYVYDLNGTQQGITSYKVYARLQPLARPDSSMPDIPVIGALLNTQGEIIDSEAHFYHE